MSSFICEKCGEHIIDSSYGYVTGCKHYPLPNERVRRKKIKKICKKGD